MEEYYNKKINNGNRWKFIKKIIIKFLYILLICFIVIESYILIQSKKNPNKSPGIFGIKAFCIISGSMEPTIKLNDVILVKETSENQLMVGTIITYIEDGDTITHRIVSIRKGIDDRLYFKTKGDANNTQDEEEITFEDIEGEYVCRIPIIGKIFTKLQSGFSIAIVIIVLIVFYAKSQSLNKRKRRRSEARKEYENEKNQKY